MKVILTVKEEDLDFILKQFLRLEIKAVKIKKKNKQRTLKSIFQNTYNEPDE